MMRAGEGKLFKRFYESLVLLHTLDPYNGDRIPSSGFIDEEGLGDSDTDLRRRFVTYLAYVCDYDTGGDTTTAIAPQETNQKIVYWIAANRNPSLSKTPSVSDFVKAILRDLRYLSNNNGTSDVKAEKQRELASRCVEFGYQRINGYLNRLRTQLDICLKALDRRHSVRGDGSRQPQYLTRNLITSRYRPRACYQPENFTAEPFSFRNLQLLL